MKLILAIGAGASAVLLAGCGLDVMYADWKVNQLCAKDGGVTVFITDVLPEYLKKSDGSFDVNALQGATRAQPYYLEQKWKQIQSTDPVITRSELRLIRSRDEALLASSVVYIRPTQNVGVPILSQDSHTCPGIDDIERLAERTFTRPANTN